MDAEATDATTEVHVPDLDAIGRDLADVEIALRRLDEGTYRIDEATGEPLPAELLAARPTARRADGVVPPTPEP